MVYSVVTNGNPQDFDIAGSFDQMVPDAEIIKIMNDVMTELNIGKFTIKVCESMAALRV